MHTALCSALVLAVAAAAPSAPNVVFILADDLGYNELGYRNASRGLQTPRIDALARAGVRLSSYYTNPLCSPSRSALMTGFYNHRIGTQSNVIYWDTPWSVPLSFEWLPAALKRAANYSTGMFGKSHLGMHTKAHYPINRGFDEHAGYMQGCGGKYSHVASCCGAQKNATDDAAYVCPADAGEDFRGLDWFAGTAPVRDHFGVPSTQLVADAAVDFIARRGAAGAPPFFLVRRCRRAAAAGRRLPRAR